MVTRPRKTAPKPVAGKDDITQWENDQPVATIIRDDPTADDYFPSGDEQPPDEPRKIETPPRIPSPVAVKARELMTRAKNVTKPKTAATKKPPKPRVSVEKLISGVWQIAAQMTAPINVPVARVIDMQAPVAGMILEDEIKNTVVDRILQPIARIEAGGETAFALIGPPLLVGVLTQKPHMAPIIIPLLRQSLMSWIEIAGPKLEQVEKKEQKFQEQYGQRIDDMISSFLSAVVVETSPNGTNPSDTTAPNTATAGTGTRG